MTKNIYLIAGEASGDVLGAGLMRALKAKLPQGVRFSGVGGEKMEAEGLKSLFPYHELALIGIVEVLPRALNIMSRLNLVVEDIIHRNPDTVVTIDVPGFTHRVVRRLRKAGLTQTRFVHYVAPTVWAYRPERAKIYAELFDLLMVLLPFEPPYFEKEGLKTIFTGHPVAYRPPGDAQAFREKYGLAPELKLIGMLPGSREGEIRRHMPPFGAAITLLAERIGEFALVVPVAKRLLPMVTAYFQGCPFRAVLIADESDKAGALAACDVALVKSGTVSLEVAQAGVPQIVGYRMHPVTAFALRRIVRIPQVNLVNILLDKPVIPELLLEDCTPELLAEGLYHLMTDEAARNVQKSAFAQALAMLRVPGGRDPNELAAEGVLGLSS